MLPLAEEADLREEIIVLDQVIPEHHHQNLAHKPPKSPVKAPERLRRFGTARQRHRQVQKPAAGSGGLDSAR